MRRDKRKANRTLCLFVKSCERMVAHRNGFLSFLIFLFSLFLFLFFREERQKHFFVPSGNASDTIVSLFSDSRETPYPSLLIEAKHSYELIAMSS